MPARTPAERFVRVLRGIREPRQRALKLVAFLREIEPPAVAEFLSDLLAGLQRSDRSSAGLHLDLLRNRDVLSRLGYETLARAYACAREKDFKEVLVLLRSDRAAAGAREQKPEGFDSALEALTVGERRQLSRSARGRRLEPLLFDSNPLVIRELLLSPKITEPQVVRIAARHKAPVPVLEMVTKSDRWMSHYSVRKALAFNPNTPVSCAAGILSHLRTRDLKLFLQIRPDRPELCEIARRKLKAV